ncbi:UDP-N-acetyl-D-mannosamine dehydrogenase [Dietzia sp. WMMA184]|uniref:UDP-N-acetyl-D-mannosamine dehydrogenase n=1 Tax=Dietzia sp. WMMA184 TaxID=2039808 RepID=UPI0020B10634|nr:UDP-N-acetyl-D-mannosamine dehydrogenase [Dietzia sp. WMMA184]
MFKSAVATNPDSALSNGRLAVIGLGYIGLPTAVVFALRGWEVIGVDVSDRTIAMVSRGELPFVEEGLDVALKTAVESGSLTASKETPEADVYVVAVPTPFAEDYSMDAKFIDAATDAIIPQLKDGNLVILESTSPPGTTEYMAQRILAARHDLAIEPGEGQGRLDMAHAPERVLPGRIIAELASNDRIVGGLTEASTIRTRDVYATFCTGTIHMTDSRTAEMAKLTENSFRDVNIAFANELSVICDRQGIDVWELISLANRHPRVNILKPGPGVGGHCIAVDPWFIVSADRENSQLIRLAREINDDKPNWVMEKVSEKLADVAPDAPIASLGLAFKPDIDDLRESPAAQITARLAEQNPGRRILAVEPNITELPASLANFRNVELVDLREAIQEAGIVVIMVAHSQFRDIAVSLVADERVVDTCGIHTG